ncbi:MAG: hypothetical protein ABDI19_10890 [Armatimonadota bacterium]
MAMIEIAPYSAPMLHGSPVEAAQAVLQILRLHARANTPFALLQAGKVEEALEQMQHFEPPERLRWYLLLLWHAADQPETAQSLLNALQRDEAVRCAVKASYRAAPLTLWLWLQLPLPMREALDWLWQLWIAKEVDPFLEAIDPNRDTDALQRLLAACREDLNRALRLANWLIEREVEPWASEWIAHVIMLARQEEPSSNPFLGKLLDNLVWHRRFVDALQLVEAFSDQDDGAQEYLRACLAYAQGDMQAVEAALEALGQPQALVGNPRRRRYLIRAMAHTGRVQEAFAYAQQSRWELFAQSHILELVRELCRAGSVAEHWTLILQQAQAGGASLQRAILSTLLDYGDLALAERWIAACELEIEDEHRIQLAKLHFQCGDIASGQACLDTLKSPEILAFSAPDLVQPLLQRGERALASALLQRGWNMLYPQLIEDKDFRKSYIFDIFDYVRAWFALGDVAQAQAVLAEGLAAVDVPANRELLDTLSAALFALIREGHLEPASQAARLLPEAQQEEILAELVEAHYQRGEVAAARDRLLQLADFYQRKFQTHSHGVWLHSFLYLVSLARRFDDETTARAILDLLKALLDVQPSLWQERWGLSYYLAAGAYAEAYAVWQQLDGLQRQLSLTDDAVVQMLIAILGEAETVEQLVRYIQGFVQEGGTPPCVGWRVLSLAGCQAFLSALLQMPFDESLRARLFQPLLAEAIYSIREDSKDWQRRAPCLDWLTQVLPRSDAFHEVWLRLAELYLHGGETEKALAIAETLRSRADPEWLGDLASLYLAAGREAMAQAIAEQLPPAQRLETLLDCACALQKRGDRAGATRWAQQILQQAAQQEPEACLWVVRDALDMMHGQAGVAFLEGYLLWAAHCLQPLVRTRLAALYAELGEPDRALAIAQELPSDAPNLLHTVSKALLQAGFLDAVHRLLPCLCETAEGTLLALGLLIRAYPESAAAIVQLAISPGVRSERMD